MMFCINQMDMSTKKYCFNPMGGPELHLNENKSVFILQTSLIISSSFPLTCMWDLWETKRQFALFSDRSPQIFKGVKQEQTLDRWLIVQGYIPMWLFHKKRTRECLHREVLIILHRWADTSRSEESKNQDGWPETVTDTTETQTVCRVVQGNSWDTHTSQCLRFSEEQ